MLTSVDDVARMIQGDERFSLWTLQDRKDHYLRLTRSPASVTLLWPELWRDDSLPKSVVTEARLGTNALVLLGSDEDFIAGDVSSLTDIPNLMVATIPISPVRLVTLLRAREQSMMARWAKSSLELELQRARRENELLGSTGRALSQHRDTNSLLALILQRAREVTNADAGTVYIVEPEQQDANPIIRFANSQNDSIELQANGHTMEVSASSIVGACVLNGETIAIKDLYLLDPPRTGNNPWGFVHDRSFDEKHGYQTRSMLAVPMVSARDQVIGVIQLINRRRVGFGSLTKPSDFERGVAPFDDASADHATTLASQAGIALENALLYAEVQQLFDGFVRASVTAIESRDPSTSGHSERVAKLTVGLADAADRTSIGAYAGLHLKVDDMKQIEYAALLHDFGKVGVREHVLVKANKLYEHQRQLVVKRFQFIRRTMEAERLQKKVSYLLEESRDGTMEKLRDFDGDTNARLAELDEFLQFVLFANEPSVLEDGNFDRIADIAARTYLDQSGVPRPYLTPAEVEALQVMRGSLTAMERAEIESHVVHTYNFLKQIPWGRAYRDVPIIAGAHHEKLNGDGYPHGLRGDEIPVPSRMMTISDIYDALTASDRPYKRAIPAEQALDILAYEVKAGRLDADLFQLFTDAKVYKVVEKTANER